MTQLSIDSFVVVGLGYGPGSGNIDARFGEQKLQIKFTDAQCAELSALVLGYVIQRQAALADEIRTAQPALLASPEAIDGEWTDA